jgi:hypothetical protein
MATLRIDAPGWKPEKHNKKTCIGKRNVKMSSMNKRKKASYKKYRGQG